MYFPRHSVISHSPCTVLYSYKSSLNKCWKVMLQSLQWKTPCQTRISRMYHMQKCGYWWERIWLVIPPRCAREQIYKNNDWVFSLPWRCSHSLMRHSWEGQQHWGTCTGLMWLLRPLHCHQSCTTTTTTVEMCTEHAEKTVVYILR